MKRRELLAAAIVKDYRFITQMEMNLYLDELKRKNISYRVEETHTTQAGPVLARISVGYNNSPLIQLYDT